MARKQQTRLTLLLLIASVVSGVALCRLLPDWFPIKGRPGESHFDVLRRLEWITYDWRMRWASGRGGSVATNLGAVFIDDKGLAQINQEWGYHWPWPRQLYGRALRELTAQRVEAVACDVFFLETQADFTETRVALPDGRSLSSDAFFAAQLQRSGNVILGAPGELTSGTWRLIPPVPLFRTNALGLGLASTDRDSDGVLRRARPFRDDPEFGRVWHLGLRLAATHLGLDLTNAIVGPHAILLRGERGVSRTIPLDDQGCLLIDWSLSWYDRRMATTTFDEVLAFDQYRQSGETNLEPALEGRLVFIGSIGTGSNISDVGATPVEKETYLVSKHWNVANALLQDRFIRPSRVGEDIVLIVVMGGLAGWLTWRLRALWASFCVVGLMAAYTTAAVWCFAEAQVWLPLALPLGGALVMIHVAVVTWRVMAEQNERRRVRGVFSRLVSPDVVNELLDKERLEWGGTLRDVTVLFADVRGFTKLTDENQRFTEEFVREHGLTGSARDAVFAENARETLATVNAYLSLIAENVKKHRGTLDKYIGDCVMAFWGSPLPDPQHAVAAVKAAIDSQRAIAELNRTRSEENARRHSEEKPDQAQGPMPQRPLGLLSLGTGINTGLVTVGLMGSDAHILNYTVFGREVNVASRLESVSGYGRIVISASTHAALATFAPELASRCVPLPAVTVKGIADPIPIFEVPWREAAPGASSEPGTDVHSGGGGSPPGRTLEIQ